MTATELTDICAQMAELMIMSGAEVYRVEDTSERICKAYGYDNAEISASPIWFIITIRDKNRQAYTDTKAMRYRKTNLDRVGELNELSRYICENKPSYQDVMERFKAISQKKTYSKIVVSLSFMIVGAVFAAIYGGGLVEIIVASLLALLVKFMRDILTELGSSSFLSSLVCSVAVAFIAVVMYKCNFISEYETVIIGSFMTMVPGVAITNCMRDFISGDLFSGIYTLAEALLTAVGMAVGAGIAIGISGVVI